MKSKKMIFCLMLCGCLVTAGTAFAGGRPGGHRSPHPGIGNPRPYVAQAQNRHPRRPVRVHRQSRLEKRPVVAPHRPVVYRSAQAPIIVHRVVKPAPRRVSGPPRCVPPRHVPRHKCTVVYPIGSTFSGVLSQPGMAMAWNIHLK